MARKTNITREDVLAMLPLDTQKHESRDHTREVYCFTDRGGNKSLIGFVEDEPLPSFEHFDLSAQVAEQSAQAFLSAAV